MNKIFALFFSLCLGFSAYAASDFYSFQVKTADNKDQSLGDYKGQVVLVVNVASRCGYTPQYEGLQKLYSTYKANKFAVLGFPSNQFLGQEPGTNEEIQKFCKLSYGVDFPVFAKVDVNGKDQAPLYKWLKSNKGFEGDIGWNFNKFLINRSGEVVKRYGSSTKPSEIEKDIKNLVN
ncbi:MAG: glutathione peroxidase [Bdellovibrio sp.]|nr:glutathione peroxidase [Bdellovibrio sp.]